jgi:type VI protein secretion system component Hcp
MVSIFAKIDGITGTGKGAYQGWLKAESFAIGQSRDSQLLRFQDAVSPMLFRFYRNSVHIPKVTIDAVKNGSPFWRVEMSDVVISGLEVSGVPQRSESLALNYVGIRTLVGAGLSSASASGAAPGARAWSFDGPRR